MEVFYNVQIILKNEFGDFLGKKAKISQKQYEDLIDMSRKFHVVGGFELLLEDDTFMVFPPDIVKKSILIIKKEVI